VTDAPPLTLGTAGHIDHGKTTLVHMLTGTDTDRLPEERARGISIALGYAALRTPQGRRLSVIDVPGHERFVRTMVAGATGIDMFLMVIAADDGVMPQTLEHATVLRALGIKHGVVAITKIDLADPTMALRQAEELLPDCVRVACSTRSGDGLDRLLSALDRVSDVVASRTASQRGVVLHIDRAFTIKGHGTVVTGTLASGRIDRGDTLILLPSEAHARVRALEIHGVRVDRADAGQRVAVNLVGTRLHEVHRGDALVGPGVLHQTVTIDCALSLTGDRHNTRVQVHHGTRDVAGRLLSLTENLWQLRLERPLLAADGDRIVIRTQAPPDTLGGGVILDSQATRHGRRAEIVERLRRRRDGLPDPAIATRVPSMPPPPPSPAAQASPSPQEAAEVLGQLRAAALRPLTQDQLGVDPSVLRALRTAGSVVCVRGKLYLDAEAADAAHARVVDMLTAQRGMTLAELRDGLGLSRKATQTLLEHLDTIGVTRRLPDDRRILSRSLRDRVR